MPVTSEQLNAAFRSLRRAQLTGDQLKIDLAEEAMNSLIEQYHEQQRSQLSQVTGKEQNHAA